MSSTGSCTDNRHHGDRAARVLLAVAGVAIIAMCGLGAVIRWWSGFPLITGIPFGALLIVLSAFYARVVGEIRCGLFRLTIAPGPSVRPPVAPPSIAGEVQAARGSPSVEPESPSVSASPRDTR